MFYNLLCNLYFSVIWCDWFSSVKRSETSKNQKPNIIIISANELGWDDISLHGNPLAVTPNIDTFVRHGVTLNNHYISSYEFSTRLELFTGQYSSRFGLQKDLTSNLLPFSMPETNLTIPKILKTQGYTNHFLGKWGLGFAKKSSLPIYQGFDTFVGSISNKPVNYFTYMSKEGNYSGYDLYNQSEVLKNVDQYSQIYYSDLATDIIYSAAKNPDNPFFLFLSLQIPESQDGADPSVPKNWIEYFDSIYQNDTKKNHAAMVMVVDIILGKIMDALAASSILDRSCILFMSQSTGNSCSYNEDGSCNFPLRGSRGTVWEGGIRSTALFYSSKIATQGTVIDELIHVTDWLPTFAELAKYKGPLNNLNGVNILPTLMENKPTRRTFMLFDIYAPYGQVTAFRMHEYKLVIGQKLGTNGLWSKDRIFSKNQTDALVLPGFKPTSEQRKNYSSVVLCDRGYPHPFLSIHAPPCKPESEPCLFNIDWDPCEYHNLASFMPRTTKFIIAHLNQIKMENKINKPIELEPSPSANPDLHNGTWSYWIDDIIEEKSQISANLNFSISTGIDLNITNSSDTISGVDDKNYTSNSEKSESRNNHDGSKYSQKYVPNGNKVLVGTLETSKGSAKDEEENITEAYVEKIWKTKHETLDLERFMDSKNISRNRTVFNNTNITLPANKIEKTEILEIYETPTSDVNVFSVSENLTEKDVKRTNLPDNTIDYKIAISRGKTEIKGSDPLNTGAFLKTKAFAGGVYDEKSNSYSKENQMTSLDDENLKNQVVTPRIYSLHSDINETKIENQRNSSVEEFFIDWDLLSRQSSIVTTQNPMPLPLKNLVTEAPVSFEVNSFKNTNFDNKIDSVIFQRTLKDKPKTSTFVLAESDADTDSSKNIHKLSYSTENDGENFLKAYKNFYQPVTPSAELEKNFGNTREKIEIISNENLALEKENHKVIEAGIGDDKQLEGFNMIFDKNVGSKNFPFHGSLKIGNSRQFEFEGTANGIEPESDSNQVSQNKMIVSKTNDLSHFQGLNLVSINPQNPNKTEITESGFNIKHLNDSDIGEKGKTEKYALNQRSNIPSAGSIGDESGTLQNSDDILKMFSALENNTLLNSTISIQEISPNTVAAKNISEEVVIVKNDSNTVGNVSSQNLTLLPIANITNLNESNPQKKDFPFSRPLKFQSASSTMASSIVAVVLSAFVIVGMTLIAIVSVVSKSYGHKPIEKVIPIVESPKSPDPPNNPSPSNLSPSDQSPPHLSPSGSTHFNAGIVSPPRRYKRLNR